MRSFSTAAALAVTVAGCGPEPLPEARILAVPFHVIAHRGASAYAPENTLPAFRRALELGASEVEFDVQLSRDGVLVLFHDRSLDQKTDLQGSVREHTAAELARADIGRWFDAAHPEVPRRYAGTRLLALTQLFEALGDRLHYHVEIKAEDPEIPALLLREIARFELEKHVTITSFFEAPLARVRALDPELPICLLVRDARTPASMRRRIEDAVRAGFDQVAFPAQNLDPEVVGYAHDRGLEVRAWRIGGDADMERAIRAGANGMTTNWPDRLLARIARDGREAVPAPSPNR